MLSKLRFLYAPDTVTDGEFVADTPPTDEDIVVVDELPVESDADAVDTGGKSVKEILAENEALRQQADQASAIQRGITDLGTVLQKQQPANQQPPAMKPGETREEYAKRFNKEFFGADSYTVLEDAVKKMVTPYINQVQQSVATVNRALYKDDFIYKTYKDEVEGKIAALPADQQSHPQVVEWAIKQVKADHVEDIVEMKIQEALAAQQAAPQSNSQPSQSNPRASFVEGGGATSTTQRKVTPITRAEQQMMNVYIGRGLSYNDAKDKVLRDRSR
jgi:hypothetical protein